IEVEKFINLTTRRRSPAAVILDSQLMIALVYVYEKTVKIFLNDVENFRKEVFVKKVIDETELVTHKRKKTADQEIPSGRTMIIIPTDDMQMLPADNVLARDWDFEIYQSLVTDSSISANKKQRRQTDYAAIQLPTITEEALPPFDLQIDAFGPLGKIDEIERTTLHQQWENDEIIGAPKADRHGQFDFDDRPQETTFTRRRKQSQSEFDLFMSEMMLLLETTKNVYLTQMSTIATKTGPLIMLSGTNVLTSIQSLRIITADQTSLLPLDQMMDVIPPLQTDQPTVDAVVIEKQAKSKKPSRRKIAISKKLDLVKDPSVWYKVQNDKFQFDIDIQTKKGIDKVQYDSSNDSCKKLLNDIRNQLERIRSPLLPIQESKEMEIDVPARLGPASSLLPTDNRSASITGKPLERSPSRYPDSLDMPGRPTNEMPAMQGDLVLPNDMPPFDTYGVLTTTQQYLIQSILALASQDGGGIFNELLRVQGLTKIHAARLFSELLCLCAEQKVYAEQTVSYTDIRITRILQ
ncbi:unnamed protein product, partial [Didymodactylos carnosus]